MYIGPYQLSNNLIVAPMAGVTDRPFRSLCKYFGAGHAVSEMMTSDQTLRMSKKSLYRANFDGELAPISAQIAGSDPKELAEAARYQVSNGAQIVDINMGCPAKKVCNKLAGSALLKDEASVRVRYSWGQLSYNAKHRMPMRPTVMHFSMSTSHK